MIDTVHVHVRDTYEYLYVSSKIVDYLRVLYTYSSLFLFMYLRMIEVLSYESTKVVVLYFVRKYESIYCILKVLSYFRKYESTFVRTLESTRSPACTVHIYCTINII